MKKTNSKTKKTKPLNKHVVSHSCVFCDKLIKRLHFTKSPDWQAMWDDGVVDKIAANYGSRFDGNMYIIAICDKCIEEKEGLGKIKFIGNYMESNCG